MDTRDKILQTTFLLLIEKGYDRISITDIQKQAGVSRGLLYYFFKNKTDLLFAACRKYFFDKYMTVDVDTITFRGFLDHIKGVVHSLTDFDGHEIDILKYNTLYSCVLVCEPRFWDYIVMELKKASIIIENAKKRGEIKDLPTHFIGATFLSILGRTSYVTATPSNAYIRSRILEDIDMLYELISLH